MCIKAYESTHGETLASSYKAQDYWYSFPLLFNLMKGCSKDVEEAVQHVNQEIETAEETDDINQHENVLPVYLS